MREDCRWTPLHLAATALLWAWSDEALANALGMSVQIVETIDAEELREQQAKRRAAQLVGMVQGTMGLESQAVDQKTIESLTKRNATRLLAGSNRRLWDE
jgi:hypothetical protein